MRKTVNLNENWVFCKSAKLPEALPQDWEPVSLPHTWNAKDGQDGGGDYFRGHGWYAKSIRREDLPEAEQYFLEINGANSSADVYWNGSRIAHHDGGYATWRAKLPEIGPENLLVVDVDNAPNETVYPQVADFTFYGGLYRNVNVIGVCRSHFDLESNGTPGIRATADAERRCVMIETPVQNAQSGQCVRYAVKDAKGNVMGTAEVPAAQAKVEVCLAEVHLWHGRKDPYLYTVEAELIENDSVLDQVHTRVGFRTFRVDPENGFILNGEEYPLRGVSRHQDRWGIGNALLPEHHREDIELIDELGATTIRLAHYQHDPYFYDLCDEKGFIVWAEIPYISRHMPGGRANTIQQMTELITQNYNHASIVCWGLSNEITMGGSVTEDLKENHRELNELCHRMDKTRFTTMACLSTASITDPYVFIPDVVSYNHYFGWYGGETDMNGPWMDEFHKTNPGTPIGLSEYGCEALNWHTSAPQAGDYTEEYQAYYHEELIKQLFSRKYIWATHVWNMFDFGCDGRNEGGENGQNHKGLVTIDRKYKKDAFYAYKAWLSEDPFVHICGKRYVDRVEDVTKVTVYSNQPWVELFANGVSLGRQESAEHFFYFQVPNGGVTKLEAVAGDCTDNSEIHKVETFNEAYRLKEAGAVLNWFDVTTPEGYYSINDKISDIMSSFRGKLLLAGFAGKLMKQMKSKQAENAKDGKQNTSDMAGMMKKGDMMKMIGGFTVLRIANMSGVVGITVSKEMLLDFNRRLNRVRKKN